MSRITTIHCPKILVSPLDTSIATFSNLGFSAGTLVNSGLSFFGGTLQLGVARAAVNIGPPVAIPGVSLPFSLWVDGVSVFVGATFFGGARFSFAFVQNNGFCQANGATQKNGADMTNGVKIDNAAQLKNGLSISNSGKKSTILISPLHTGRSMGNKTFDIEHPNKKGWRLRHVCVEGPESAVYIRGRLTGSNIIIPDSGSGYEEFSIKWEIEDYANNITEHIQTIRITDNIGPDISDITTDVSGANQNEEKSVEMRVDVPTVTDNVSLNSDINLQYQVFDQSGNTIVDWTDTSGTSITISVSTSGRIHVLVRCLYK